jgi:hypothetical protein
MENTAQLHNYHRHRFLWTTQHLGGDQGAMIRWAEGKEEEDVDLEEELLEVLAAVDDLAAEGQIHTMVVVKPAAEGRIHTMVAVKPAEEGVGDSVAQLRLLLWLDLSNSRHGNRSNSNNISITSRPSPWLRTMTIPGYRTCPDDSKM